MIWLRQNREELITKRNKTGKPLIRGTEKSKVLGRPKRGKMWWWQRRRVNNVEGNVEWKCKDSLSLRIKWELELKRVPPEKEGKVWKYIMMNYSTARATKANWRVPSNVEHAGIFYHFVLLQHIVYNDAASVPTRSESIMGGIEAFRGTGIFLASLWRRQWGAYKHETRLSRE